MDRSCRRALEQMRSGLTPGEAAARVDALLALEPAAQLDRAAGDRQLRDPLVVYALVERTFAAMLAGSGTAEQLGWTALRLTESLSRTRCPAAIVTDFEAVLWCVRGRVRAEGGRAEAGLPLLAAARTLAGHGSGDPTTGALVEHELGVCLLRLGEDDAAVQAFGRAAALYQDAGESLLEAWALTSLSRGLEGTGEAEVARRARERAQELLDAERRSGPAEPRGAVAVAVRRALDDARPR